MIFVTIVAFIVIFSLLVLVHEWGHFAAARRAGIKVEEFGIGLPPRAKAIYTDKQGTVYSINWIPFGGYVRLYGEDSSDPAALKDPRSFASKKWGSRAAVVVAGVLMNFLLAWILITFGWIVGMRPFLITQQDVQAAMTQGLVESVPVLYVHEVLPDSPAAKAGLVAGDMIISVNDAPTALSEGFGKSLKTGVNHLIVVHAEKEQPMEITPDSEGKVGVSISDEQFITAVNPVRYPWYIAPLKAAREVGRLSVLTVKMLGNVLVSLVAKFAIPEGVAGPVGIATMTYKFVQQGFMALLQFMALISISLGVLNIMPFPALDGGRLLFLLFELVLRRRPSPKWESIIHSAGFALLLLLIFAVTWKDVVNLLK
ncbi:MAG: site-2 protease family protein [Candidatus Peregrinibacteria bacterium]